MPTATLCGLRSVAIPPIAILFYYTLSIVCSFGAYYFATRALQDFADVTEGNISTKNQQIYLFWKIAKQNDSLVTKPTFLNQIF